MAVTTDRGPGSGIAGKALAVVGVLALVAAGWLGLRALDEPGAADAASSAAGATGGSQVPMRTHGSPKGGFTVSAPASFRLKRKGEVLSLVSRDRRIVVTVGPGPAGSLESAHAALSDAVVASYDGANLEVTERIRIGGQPASRPSGPSAPWPATAPACWSASRPSATAGGSWTPPPSRRGTSRPAGWRGC
jgi:hypothetical protein